MCVCVRVCVRVQCRCSESVYYGYCMYVLCICVVGVFHVLWVSSGVYVWPVYITCVPVLCVWWVGVEADLSNQDQGQEDRWSRDEGV